MSSENANSGLEAALNRLRLAKENSTLPKHEAWVPFPEKEVARQLGVRWNDAAKRHEFAAADSTVHPCSRYLPANFIPLKAPLPINASSEFKEFGVITRKEGDKWNSYVMADEKYEDLIKGLGELELL